LNFREHSIRETADKLCRRAFPRHFVKLSANGRFVADGATGFLGQVYSTLFSAEGRTRGA
jgi:hypothetical protein